MWLPWEEARLRSWADELEAAGDVLGDRIKRSLDAPKGSTLGMRAKLSLEANRAAQRGVGEGAARLLKQLGGFEGGWEHGALRSLRPRLYADERAPEPETVEGLYRLLREPIARFLQELALPGEWDVRASASAPSLVSQLEGAGLQLRVLRLGEAHELRADPERRRPGSSQGVDALASLLSTGDREGRASAELGPTLRELLGPERGLCTLTWHDRVMPLWRVGPVDNPTRLARLSAWLERPVHTAATLSLVARGLWDRSSSVRERALRGIGELGLAAAVLIPELLRVGPETTEWSRSLHATIDSLCEDPALVEAFASRLRADEEAHLRWLRRTRSRGAKAALPEITRALAIEPVAAEYGSIPPQWRRREWRELAGHLGSI